VNAHLRLTLVTALRPRSRPVVVLRDVDDHHRIRCRTLIGASPAAVKNLSTRGLAKLRNSSAGTSNTYSSSDYARRLT
jgi:DNA-directed RNA polymerase specialized sigma24 family protein